MSLTSQHLNMEACGVGALLELPQKCPFGGASLLSLPEVLAGLTLTLSLLNCTLYRGILYRMWPIVFFFFRQPDWCS